MAEEGPDIGFTSPEDGEWFSSSEVRVEGWASSRGHQTFMNMSQLGRGQLENLRYTGDLLVFRLQRSFNDDFDGAGLDLDKWTVVDSGGYYGLYQGQLYTISQYISGENHAPLLVSNDTAFPTNDLVSWTAEFSMMYNNNYCNDLGGGIANSSTIADESLMSAYMLRGDNYWVRVYIDGEDVWSAQYDGLRWRTYRLAYNSGTQKYTAYVDDVKVGNPTSIDEMAKFFWFGTNEPILPQGYPQGPLYIDYARVITQDGLWTSPVIDMEEPLTYDALDLAWNSSHPASVRTSSWVSVSMDNFTWSPWTLLDGDVPDEDVTGRYVRFRVRIGLPASAPLNANIRVDGISIGYHFPVASLAYSLNGGGWAPIEISPTWNFTVDLEEGPNNITLRAIDTRSSVSLAYLDLIMDTTPPTGTVAINGGDAWSNHRNVTLTLDATDLWGVVTVELSNDPVNLMWHARPYNTTLEWRTPDHQGEVTVFARFTDSHGIVSGVSTDTIMHDPVPPVARIKIEAGAIYTPTTVVEVSLEYTDLYPIGRVMLSNSADMTDAVDVEIGTTEHTWDLGVAEDGTASCYIAVWDMAGNEAIASDSIEVYFPKVVGSIEIEGGALLVGKSIVSVAIEVPREVRPNGMQVSEDEDFADAQWEVFAEEKMVFLSERDGLKTLYFRVEDFRGIVSLPINASIHIDTTPPVVTSTVNGGAEYATDTQVQVQVTFDDTHRPGMIWVGLEEGLGDVDPTPFRTLHTITIPEREGVHTVYIKVEDEVGNAATSSASIFLATIKPLITLHLPGGTPTNTTNEVEVTVEWHDSYGDIEVNLAWNEDPSELTEWKDPDETLMVTIPAGTADGAYHIRARARNIPGIESDVVSIDIQLDRVSPTLTITKPADGTKVVQEGKIVRVDLDIDSMEGLSEIQYRIDGGEWVDVPLDEMTLVVGIPTYGEHTLEVRVEDAAGNEAVSSSKFKLEKEEEAGVPGVAALLALAALVCGGLVVRRRG